MMPWSEFLDLLRDWAALIVAAGIVGRVLWKIWGATDYLSDLHTFLNTLYRQLTPNAGVSLDDTIRRLERNQIISHRNNERVWNLLLTFHKNDLDFNPQDYALEPIEHPPPKKLEDWRDGMREEEDDK